MFIRPVFPNCELCSSLFPDLELVIVYIYVLVLSRVYTYFMLIVYMLILYVDIVCRYVDVDMLFIC